MANSTSKSEATSDAINENISGTEDVTVDKPEEEQKNPDESNEPNHGYEDDQTQEMKPNPEKEALKNPAKTEGNTIKENNEYYQIQGGEKVKVAAEDVEGKGRYYVEGKGRYYVEGQGWYENVNGADTYIDENRVVDGKQWKIDKNGKDVYIGEVPEAFETLSKKQQDIVLKLASAESVAEKIEYVGAYLGKDWKDRIDVFWESQYSSAISNGMTPELAEMAADFTTGEVIVPVIGGIISKGGVVASDLGALEGKLNTASKETNNAGKVVEGSSKAVEVPGRVQSRINLRNGSASEGAGWDHVVDRHFNSTKNASQFTVTQEELRSILQSETVISTPISRTLESADGIRYVREISLNKTIGIDKFSGQSTSIMTVLTDKFGNLITATPGVIK